MTTVQSGRNRVTEGTMESNGSYPTSGFEVGNRARVILKGPTFGGGTVYLTVLAEDGSYYRTGVSWTALVSETIDVQGVAARFKLELDGSTDAEIGYEIRDYG